jgi:predicted transcriptional regulator
MPQARAYDSVRPSEVLALAEAMGCHTQSDLGTRLGITQSRVSQILSGAYPIKPGPLLTLVRELQAQHGQRGRKRE